MSILRSRSSAGLQSAFPELTTAGQPAPGGGYGGGTAGQGGRPARLPDARSVLLPISGLLAHKSGSRHRVIGPISRLMRAGLKGLMRPWLDFQTRFNHRTIDVIEESTQQLEAAQQAVVHRLNECLRDLQVERDLLDQVSARVTDYGHAVAEHLTRVGEDVGRRLGALIDETVAQAYQERIAAECVAAVNAELSHTGEIAKAGLWFNPPIGVRIVGGAPAVTAVTERILEGIFVHTRLPKPPARLLDMGCAESTNALEMASMGYQVVGVDVRRLPVGHPSLSQVQANLAALPFPDESFDVVVCLSTLEHVGLGWYDRGDEATDGQAITEAARVLRSGGTLIMTTPFGRPAVTPVHRVYGRDRLEELLQPFRVTEWAYGVRDGESWSFTTDGDRAAAAESAERVSAVALIVAEKP